MSRKYNVAFVFGTKKRHETGEMLHVAIVNDLFGQGHSSLLDHREELRKDPESERTYSSLLIQSDPVVPTLEKTA